MANESFSDPLLGNSDPNEVLMDVSPRRNHIVEVSSLDDRPESDPEPESKKDAARTSPQLLTVKRRLLTDPDFAAEFAQFKVDHGLDKESANRLLRKLLLFILFLTIVTIAMFVAYSKTNSADQNDPWCDAHPYDPCPSSTATTVCLVLGVIFASLDGVFAFSICCVFCVRASSLADVEQGDYVYWVLEGEQWQRFVEFTVGENRRVSHGLLCSCIIRKRYRKQKAMSRGRFLIGPKGICKEGAGWYPIGPMSSLLKDVKLIRLEQDLLLYMMTETQGKSKYEHQHYFFVPEDVPDEHATQFLRVMKAREGQRGAVNATIKTMEFVAGVAKILH